MRYILLLLPLCLLVGCERVQDTPSTQPTVIGQHEEKPIGDVSIWDVFKEYSENPAAADEKYLGKVYTVSGGVESIETDSNGYSVCIWKNETDKATLKYTKDQSGLVKNLKSGELVMVKARFRIYSSVFAFGKPNNIMVLDVVD